ncbi:2'-5' RNA ligase family protein [Hymenobacter koreensis]|uniref:2'-5' RNA ligase family protein n=1 Tax=Hymenobacter koreensis TaxID=1084523 RepID=A0ABP8J3R1_9BACT
MLAITSLLNPQNATRINGIIQSLEDEFGLDDVQATPDPHITYLLAGVNEHESLKAMLADIAATTAPFPAYTTGLGLFPGPNPVIYIPVLRSPELNALHMRLVSATAPLCQRTDRFSQPDLWLPHISLALHDTTPDLLGPVLQYLNEQTFNLRIRVSNLAILRQEGEQFVPEEIYPLEGDEPQ